MLNILISVSSLNTAALVTVSLEFAFCSHSSCEPKIEKKVVNRPNITFSGISQITESPQLAMGHLLMSHVEEVVQSLHEILCGMYNH